MLIQQLKHTLENVAKCLNTASFSKYIGHFSTSSTKRLLTTSQYMFKVNNRNTRKRFEICSKLTIKTPEWCQWVVLVSLLLTLNIFHNLFYSFCCLLWAGKCRQGYYFLVPNQTAVSSDLVRNVRGSFKWKRCLPYFGFWSKLQYNSERTIRTTSFIIKGNARFLFLCNPQKPILQGMKCLKNGNFYSACKFHNCLTWDASNVQRSLFERIAHFI